MNSAQTVTPTMAKSATPPPINTAGDMPPLVLGAVRPLGAKSSLWATPFDPRGIAPAAGFSLPTAAPTLALALAAANTAWQPLHRIFLPRISSPTGYDDPHEGHVTVTAISQLLANLPSGQVRTHPPRRCISSPC